MLSSESTEFLTCKSRSYSTLELVIMSTNTQRMTLKSPEMSSDDDKQSSYRLMDVLCRTKARVINDRKKKATIFSLIFRLHASQ